MKRADAIAKAVQEHARKIGTMPRLTAHVEKSRAALDKAKERHGRATEARQSMNEKISGLGGWIDSLRRGDACEGIED